MGFKGSEVQILSSRPEISGACDESRKPLSFGHMPASGVWHPLFFPYSPAACAAFFTICIATTRRCTKSSWVPAGRGLSMSSMVSSRTLRGLLRLRKRSATWQSRISASSSRREKRGRPVRSQFWTWLIPIPSAVQQALPGLCQAVSGVWLCFLPQARTICESS